MREERPAASKSMAIALMNILRLFREAGRGASVGDILGKMRQKGQTTTGSGLRKGGQG
ncbi:hypothetical protein RSK20926_18117 [Roseobacter sp. SK209-2-6]|nr:hypothetical protein RSK20926_18117 [Roseobacter sp. SK209-2-6]